MGRVGARTGTNGVNKDQDGVDECRAECEIMWGNVVFRAEQPGIPRLLSKHPIMVNELFLASVAMCEQCSQANCTFSTHMTRRHPNPGRGCRKRSAARATV